MRDSRKRADGSSASKGTTSGAAGSGKQDPAVERLVRMGRSVGNDEVQKRLSEGNGTRDELLNGILERLRSVRGVQLQELALVPEQREWWKLVADANKTEFTKPDPTQWEECAKLYELAAEQLCRGSLARGAEVMKQAMEAEEKARENLTALVRLEEGSRAVDVDGLGEVAPGQACGACAVPAEIRDLAFAIERVGTELEDPPMRRRVRDPWWTLEEEEEEGADDAGGA